ncbi:MAG: hypothetical protein J0I81_06480, partial [Hyphomicrobium sp.]|nr:hypothetical protein [Hyphomicrobium sp.]
VEYGHCGIFITPHRGIVTPERNTFLPRSGRISGSVMRQTKSVVFRGPDRARKIDRYRRRAWVQRRVTLRSVELPAKTPHHVRSCIPGEFPEPPKSKSFALFRRGVGLTSDLLILLVASPFFAVWFLYRGAMMLLRGMR